jgi:hypothetical protein
MKGRKKLLGMKHKVREEKKREQRVALAVAVAILISIIFFFGFLINSMLNQPLTSQPVSSTSESKAAIVDHLSLTVPNQTFIQTAINTLEKAGYSVDYYEGERVTVDFYRNLPAHGYGLIVLRVHSALMGGCSPPVALFTSEPASKTKYVYEQLTDQLVGANFRDEETIYFGIAPLFVKHSMNGRFEDSIIILMGCDGLTYTSMAEAFIEKGAKVYISWSGSVLASHTDLATSRLLQHYLIEKRTLREALIATFKEVGPDPMYKSVLLYYSIEA